VADQVTLTLKADTSQYVKGIKDAQKATEDLYKTVEKGAKREKGLIEDLEDSINELTAAKKKAYRVEDIEKYNKKIEEAKIHLNEYEQAGVKANTNVEKSGNNLLRSVKAWALGFATITTAVAAFKAIVESTDALSDKFAATLNGWKEGFSAMARAIANNDFKDFFKNVKEAVKEGQRFTETQEAIEDSTRAARIEIAKNKTEFAELRVQQQNRNLTEEERIKIGNRLKDILLRNSALEVEIAKRTLDNDLTNAATKAKTTKEIVKAYLDQDEALLKNIETGKKYNELQEQLRQTVTTVSTGTASVTVVDEKRAKVIRQQIEDLGKEGELYSDLAKNITNVIDTQKDKLVTDYEAIEAAEEAQYNLRAESSLNSLLAAQDKKTDEKAVKDKEDYYNKLKQLQDEYDKSVIGALTGKGKLEAQRDYDIKQIKEVRDTLSELGPLSEEQLKQLQILADNVWKEYSDALAKEAKLLAPQEIILDVEIKTQEDKLKGLKEQLTLQPENEQIKKQIDEIEANIARLEKEKVTITVELKEIISTSLEIPELPGIQKMTQNTVDNIKKQLESNAAMEPFSIWKLFGIDPDEEEGKEVIDAFQKFADAGIDIIEETLDRKVEIAQRERELLDTQIAETQRALESEIDLYEAGYASNVALKKQELEQLKKARDAALKDEEKAIKQQQKVETILQTINLITASTELFKSFSKIPIVGIPLAIAMIGTMFAAFVSAKAKAAAATKLAEGGSGDETGIITGKRHSQGGEKFLDFAEVEQGEAWGVLSRPATQKYGTVFHNIVSSFNRDEMPQFTPSTNNVRIENSGPNTRLDKVITEQRKLNQALSKQTQIGFIGNKRIIRNGNKVRIIG
jgi:hypothetical protein